MSAKTRLWAIVTGLLGILVILYGVFAGFVPQLQTASQIRVESDTMEFLIETQEAQLLRLQQADSESFTLKRELQELEVSIPTQPEWAGMLRELQRIQDVTGAVASGIQVQVCELPEAVVEEVASGNTDVVVEEIGDTTSEPAAPVGTGLIRIPVTFTITGEEEQIAEFIRQLQVSDRLMFATSVEIDAKASPVPTGTVIGSIYVTP
ncbi:MAG: hypothetical protein GX814_09020 [Microbacteriaceae bacterium]|nr:hypothetical protein [Microbacteriaceae bacterium]